MSADADLTPEAREDAIKLAEASGFEVVRGDAQSLLLDLDTAEAIAQFDRVFPVVERIFPVQEIRSWLSKSGKTHRVVTLWEPLPVEQRVLLQAALGSDGVREVLTLARIRNGVREPSLLFKPQQDVAEVFA